jgi:hypothetical protein
MSPIFFQKYIFAYPRDLKYKVYLYLHDSIEKYLYYAIVKFKIQIYICTIVFEIA